ncbi:trypsin, partial [Oesophagostomum dentatum]
LAKNFREPQDFVLVVGSKCPRIFNCTSELPAYPAVKVFSHPNFDICNLHHDIAVIELGGDVNATDAVPICMPAENEEIPDLIKVIGYGLNGNSGEDNLLQMATREYYGTDPWLIFTGDSTVELCKGDSGGPLFHRKRNRYVLLGVFSAGANVKCKDVEINEYSDEWSGKDIFEEAHENLKKGKITQNEFNKMMRFIKFAIHADVRQDLEWICYITGVCPDGQ